MGWLWLRSDQRKLYSADLSGKVVAWSEEVSTRATV